MWPSFPSPETHRNESQRNSDCNVNPELLANFQALGLSIKVEEVHTQNGLMMNLEKPPETQ